MAHYWSLFVLYFKGSNSFKFLKFWIIFFCTCVLFCVDGCGKKIQKRAKERKRRKGFWKVAFFFLSSFFVGFLIIVYFKKYILAQIWSLFFVFQRFEQFQILEILNYLNIQFSLDEVRNRTSAIFIRLEIFSSLSEVVKWRERQIERWRIGAGEMGWQDEKGVGERKGRRWRREDSVQIGNSRRSRWKTSQTLRTAFSSPDTPEHPVPGPPL